MLFPSSYFFKLKTLRRSVIPPFEKTHLFSRTHGIASCLEKPKIKKDMRSSKEETKFSPLGSFTSCQAGQTHRQLPFPVHAFSNSDKKTSTPPVQRLFRARGGSRTRDQQFRKLLLYPTELPKRFFSLFSFPAKAGEAQN